MDVSSLILRIEMLGGLRIRRGDILLERFQTQKTGALLAYLALHLRQQHSREELIDMLWPDAPLDAGRHRLSQALTWLRPHLEPTRLERGKVLWANRQTVGLNPHAIQTDVSEFETAIQSSFQMTDNVARIKALEQAIGLNTGDLLPGYYDGWTLTARQRLLEGFLSVLRHIIAHYEEAHQPAFALEYARRAVAADPMSEEAHCDLIRLLSASGQPDAALRQYRTLEQMLARELEEKPSPKTYALAEQVRQNRPSSKRPQPSVSPTALPAPLTRFFGREDELRQVLREVQSKNSRLVTLIGAGGCGKTRLAIKIAHSLLEHYAGAVWFVPLADLDDPTLIPATVAEALRLSHSNASPSEQIVDALASRPALLVLDNLEHLTTGAVPQVQWLLGRLPQLTIIGTSQQRLQIEGEIEVVVPPLPLPSLSENLASPDHLLLCASVQLFVDRAQAIRPSFRITPQNADSVARLCTRLEGIPLAIELCAAWAQTLSLEEMQTRLDRRFDLLVSRRTGIAARQRTLRATVEYSYVQLSPTLKRLFARLSVFRNGWTLAAAEAVCRDTRAGHQRLNVLIAMTELRERSLVTADEVDGEMRYSMLETLREYAAEQLPPPETIRRRRAHAAYFLELAEQSEPYLQGTEQAHWLGRLEREIENLRASLAWAADAREADLGLRLGSALGTFWDIHGYLEERQAWLDRLLALPRSEKAIRAKALNTRGHLARNQGYSSTVNAVMQEALSLWRELGDEYGLATALQILATLAYSHEDCDEAQIYLSEGLLLARKIGNPALVARALLNLGNIALEQSEWSQAWTLYTESLSLSRSAGIRTRTAYALNNLGLVARYRGDFSAAQELLQESLEICRESEDRTGIAESLLNLGTISRLQSNHTNAREMLRNSARIASEAGEKRIFVWCIKELGHVACAMGAYSLGVHLLSTAESLRESMGISFMPAGPGDLAHQLEQARLLLGKAGVDAAWASGFALPPAEARAAFLSALTVLDEQA
jgi:predicted ATPase/DNA-binding SARP family transcriptional activator